MTFSKFKKQQNIQKIQLDDLVIFRSRYNKFLKRVKDPRTFINDDGTYIIHPIGWIDENIVFIVCPFCGKIHMHKRNKNRNDYISLCNNFKNHIYFIY